MSRTPNARSFLLEQLEARCLLAGGLFSFAHAHDERNDHRGDATRKQERLRDDRPAELRGVELAPSDRVHREVLRGDKRSSRHGRPPQHPTLPVVQTLIVTVSDREEPSTSQRPSNADVLGRSVWTVIPEELTRAGNDRSSPKQSLRPGPSSNASLSAPDVDRVLVATGSAETPARDAQAVDRLAVSSGGVSRDERIPFNLAPRSLADSVHSQTTQDQTDAQTQIDGLRRQKSSGLNSSRRQEGMIELFPLSGGEPLGRQNSQEEQVWELEGETLERLREVTRRIFDKQAESSDAAMAGWFEGPGGLIELETDGAPLIACQANAAILDIVLDATLGLHRSLGVAASAEASSYDETVRDAILAAIAGEQSGTAVPVDDMAAARISASAYSAAIPGSALVAGSLAIASRRRHFNAILKTHRRRPTTPH